MGLDTQYLLGLSWPVPSVVFYNGPDTMDRNTSSEVTEDHFINFLHQMMFNTTVPAVISTSEGGTEGRTSIVYARRTCNALAQAGARGVSFIYASGDDGSSGTSARLRYYDLYVAFLAGCHK